jgi:hypothetical protein
MSQRKDEKNDWHMSIYENCLLLSFSKNKFVLFLPLGFICFNFVPRDRLTVMSTKVCAASMEFQVTQQSNGSPKVLWSPKSET